MTPLATRTSAHGICHTGSGHQRPSEATPGRDLPSATALLDATARLHACREPEALLQVIADEALSLAAADGVAILLQDRSGLPTVLHLPRTNEPDLAATTRCLGLKAAHLPDPGHFPDLDRHLSPRSPSAGADDRHWPERWRSLLVADLGSPPSHQSARLLWYAVTDDGFTLCADLAVLFARHAGLALHNVNDRHHLERALDGRTVTGQATGILMNRYRLTAEKAFEVLRRCSQDRNIKLRDVAETLIHTGDLPD